MLIYSNIETEDISNTTSETDLFVFDFAEYQLLKDREAVLGPASAARITLAGRVGENYGAGAATYQFTGYMQGSSIGSLIITPSAGHNYLKYSFTVFAEPGRNRQKHLFQIDNGSSTGATVSNSINALAAQHYTSNNLVDGADFKVTLTLSIADSTVEFRRELAYVEYL